MTERLKSWLNDLKWIWEKTYFQMPMWEFDKDYGGLVDMHSVEHLYDMETVREECDIIELLLRNYYLLHIDIHSILTKIDVPFAIRMIYKHDIEECEGHLLVVSPVLIHIYIQPICTFTIDSLKQNLMKIWNLDMIPIEVAKQ